MVILAIGMAGALGMIKAGLIGMETGRDLTTATGLARAIMEEKLSVPYRDLMKEGPHGQDHVNGHARTWTVMPGDPEARLATIHITVQWKDGRDKNHQIEVAAVRAEGVVP